MMQSESTINAYLVALGQCDNEAQKKLQFVILLTQLFPEHAALIRKFGGGAEKFVNYTTQQLTDKKTGKIDSLYGNLVIEFEYDLGKTGAHAEDQLKEYIAKLWSKEKVKTDYIGITTDGLNWNVYTPSLDRSKLTGNVFASSDVQLVKNEPYQINSKNAADFYLWLDRIFFRNNSIRPEGKIICAEFGVNSPHYCRSMKELVDVFQRAKGMKEVQVAFVNWRKYLQFTYGDVEASEELFVAHTYLSAFTKILMAGVLSARKGASFDSSQIAGVLSGKFFYDLNIRNYVERDFFYWINFEDIMGATAPLWNSIYNLLRAYSFSHLDEDFLKEIYQGLVDPADRHDLGEFYTPDWLCERILNDALLAHKNAKSIPKIADITCGSGSFLRVAIRAVRAKFLTSKRLSKVEQTEAITNSIVGFEIHPLAAFIAKTNYLLAIEDLLDEVDRPYSIPVYLCDSLLDLVGKSSGDLSFPIQVANRRIEFPLNHTMNDERFDALIDYIDKITHKFKKSELGEDKLETLISKELTKHLDPSIKEFGGLLDSLVKLAGNLHDLVLNHENTIWSFVIKNNYRPVVFNQSFDLIVGNPPWLSFRYVKSEEYKTELEKLGLVKYKIAPQNSKLRTHMELATIFLAHAVERYLKLQGKIYFVLPRGIFSSDHHASFREQKHTAQMRIEEIWDLFGVEPLFRVPSCVVVASRNDREIDNQFNGRVLSGKLPSQNVNWDVASGIIMESKKPFYLVKMNDRTALSPINQSATSNDTYYIQKFKQGATILPRNYYFVDTHADFLKKKIISIKTCASTRKNSKMPYKDVNLTGSADVRFLFNSVLGENIVPFSVIHPFVVHMPLVHDSGAWRYISSREMLEQGFSDSASWFSEVENSFGELCKTGMSMFETLNYFGKLMVQDPMAKFWVLYCASGTNVCASVYENNFQLWVEHTVYWHVPASGKNEAYYLSSVLNSASLNELIKPFQAKGLLGERHVEKKILDVGIPKFDADNEIMMTLSQLGLQLSNKVSESIEEFTAKSIGKKRSDIRRRFQKEFSEIDELVMALFKR